MSVTIKNKGVSVDNSQDILDEETDVMSLLNNEIEEAVETDDDDDHELPDSIEELKELALEQREKIAKRNKSLKKSKQAQHRTQSEFDTLQERLDAIESRQQPPNTMEADKLAQQEQEWQDRVADDPSQAIAYANWKQGSLEDKVVNYLSSMQNDFNAKLEQLQGATNPERIKLESEINSLKNNEAFADLDDDVLFKLAKGLKGTKVKTPRGDIGGGRAGRDNNKPEEITDDIRRQMGFEPRDK